MPPGSTTLQVTVAYQDAIGDERLGLAVVPADATGVVLHAGWRSPTVRAAASGYVTLDAVRIRDHALLDVAATFGQAS
jgi:hypothetical protein